VRRLPDVILIGAQKCGTKSLRHFLRQHPHVVPPDTAHVSAHESAPHFFDGGLDPDVDTYLLGEAWYRAFFPRADRSPPHHRVLDASPLYLLNPLAPRRIFDLVPDVKLVVLLRDPTERAISHYFHEVRKGHESVPLMEALQAEESRVRTALLEQDYKHPSFIHHTYRRRGRYHEQISRYLRFFTPTRLLVVQSERFFAEPVETVQEVLHFIGVDPDWRPPDLSPRGVAEDRTPVGEEVRDHLDEHFRPHNRRLYDLLGRDFGWCARGAERRGSLLA
jgi:hypothetical protein